MIDRDIFEDLFVLEMANNHWGRLERGLKIVNQFGHVVRFNNVRAAIKLQFRDVDTFIHRDFVRRTDIRYIRKTLDTRMSKDDFAVLVKAALYGDANLDGNVTGDDYAVIDSNLGNGTANPLAPAGNTVVPESGTLLLSALVMLRLRRRRTRS